MKTELATTGAARPQVVLKRPQFLHELAVLVRVAAYERRLKEEAAQSERQMAMLQEQKQQIEVFLACISGRGFLGRAAGGAERPQTCLD